MTSDVADAPAGTETAGGKCGTVSCTLCGLESSLRSRSSIVTFAGAEISGGVSAPPARMMNAAGMRTLVLGAVGLLCLGALFLGTSGGRELVVAVVVLGPALTVPVDVPCVVVAAVVELVGVLAVLLAVLLAVELLEWLEPPQPASSAAASTVAQSGRRSIGAL